MVDHPYPQSRPMRVAAPMFAMLICGLSLGAGGMTLFWSGVSDRGFKREAKWKDLVERSQAVARENQDIARRNLATANECLMLIKSR